MRVEPNPNVRITGTGSYLPDRVIDNDTLRSLIKGYDESRSGPFGRWVDQVTHVHERRYGEPTTRTSDLGLVAAKRALETAGVTPKELGMIVYASFTISQMLPGDHCLLAEDLGATNAAVFNLMAACAGSVYGLGVAYGMVSAGLYEHVLVVGSETISRIINYADPLTSILFGDGAGAAVVSRRDGPPGTGMLPPFLSFQYEPRNIHMGNSNIPVDVSAFPENELQPGVQLVEQALIEMEGGPSVLRAAVQQMAGCVARCLGYEESELKKSGNGLAETLSRSRIVPHQANGRIMDSLGDRLRVAPERVTRTIYRYGNISAASNLVALDYAVRRGNMARRLDGQGDVVEVVEQPEHRIQPGELVLMPTIGGGYLMGCIGYVA